MASIGRSGLFLFDRLLACGLIDYGFRQRVYVHNPSSSLLCSHAMPVDFKLDHYRKMPEGAVSVTRPGKWGNPFEIGGWYMKGDHRNDRSAFRFTYTQALDEKYADERYTQIEDAAMAVEWFRWYLSVVPPKDTQELRGRNLACWCPLDQPCHADVLLEMANA